MDKNFLSFIGITVIIAFVFLAAMNAAFFSGQNTGNVVLPSANAKTPNLNNTGEAQVINLSAQGLNYILDKQTVQANKPVKIIANVSTLQGCLKSFVFPQFNVRKVFTPNDNFVEFIPTQKGTFAFSCSMGMGRGTLTVI